MDIKESNIISLSYEDIENKIKDTIIEGLKPVKNPITQAINAEYSLGNIFAYLGLLRLDKDFNELDIIYSKYKPEIEKLTLIVETLYKELEQ